MPFYEIHFRQNSYGAFQFEKKVDSQERFWDLDKVMKNFGKVRGQSSKFVDYGTSIAIDGEMVFYAKLNENPSKYLLSDQDIVKLLNNFILGNVSCIGVAGAISTAEGGTVNVKTNGVRSIYGASSAVPKQEAAPKKQEIVQKQEVDGVRYIGMRASKKEIKQDTKQQVKEEIKDAVPMETAPESKEITDIRAKIAEMEKVYKETRSKEYNEYDTKRSREYTEWSTKRDDTYRVFQAKREEEYREWTNRREAEYRAWQQERESQQKEFTAWRTKDQEEWTKYRQDQEANYFATRNALKALLPKTAEEKDPRFEIDMTNMSEDDYFDWWVKFQDEADRDRADEMWAKEKARRKQVENQIDPKLKKLKRALVSIEDIFQPGGSTSASLWSSVKSPTYDELKGLNFVCSDVNNIAIDWNYLIAKCASDAERQVVLNSRNETSFVGKPLSMNGYRPSKEHLVKMINYRFEQNMPLFTSKYFEDM